MQLPSFRFLLLLSMLSALLPLLASAQVEGFWLVESVWVGEQSMTPVAKWTRIKVDGSYQSGNGWLQNGAGTWTYDAATATFTPVDAYGPADPFGPFRVRFEEETMVWQREEEGALVSIYWQPIESLPRAPADQIVGTWQEAGEENSLQQMLIRWDRLFVADPLGERRLGYWFMHAHRPELELIPLDDYSANQRWIVRFEGENTMVWAGNDAANEGQIRRFERLGQ